MAASPFHIPLIDISPYLTNPTSVTSSYVIAQVRQALHTTGFFQIIGHGVQRNVQRAAFEASKRFFNLPMGTKMKYAASLESGWKGYETLAAQSYSPDMLGDLKEGVSLSMDLPEGHPLRGARGHFLTSLTVWPEELASEQYREPIEAYCDALSKLCSTILDLIAATLPYGPHVFDDMKVDAACPLRLLHYPPMPPSTDINKQHGASAHTDFSALTLLLQDEHAGLEVYDPSSETWHVVQPKPDTYVVNLGDMMIKLLGNQFKSGLHRVINREKSDRYSIVYFFDGNRGFKLAPLDNNDPEATNDKDNVMTCEEYMFDRLRSSFGRHNKHDMTLIEGR
ncbi:2OG-Fe(II) oxygenase family oxidoreductase [Hypoxylon sp. FL1857]|nr:2OG-Fe(II) oxygenase family oxidoreductase [Hypoxylon sp. FL1857]